MHKLFENTGDDVSGIKDGGFVFNTVHNIQANVPVENIIAMIDALKEFNT